MTEYFNQAWILLGVGMLTVFAVLMFVVLIGNSIILFINRFFPGTGLATIEKSIQGSLETSKIAAVVAAVKQVTGGRGNVIDIKKK
jgi:oxaloacetate decarboxylase gamma subunit